MYQLIRARVLPKALAAQWTDLNAANQIVATLYSSYRAIFLVVLPPGETEPVYVDFVQLQAEYAQYPNTLSVLLQVLGDRTLDTVPQLPDATVDYIKYSDAVRVGYRCQFASAGHIYPSTYPTQDLPDLKITRPDTDTDLSLLHSHCLLSVNGYYHRTDTDGQACWILEGGKSARALNRNHIGITSFLDVGTLTKLGLQDSWITPAPGYTTLKDKILITVPEDQGFLPKSWFLILGGYLVLPEQGVLWQMGDRQYCLDLTRLPYLERLLESKAGIDLSDLQLTPSELNASNLNLAEVWSDAVIRRYLLLSQSFLVGVDRDHLFYSKQSLRQFNEPGVFTCVQEPTAPLLVGYGRTAEYWKVLEDRVWAVTAQDTYLRNYMFNELAQGLLVNVTDQLENRRPDFISQGALLVMGAYGPKESQ